MPDFPRRCAWPARTAVTFVLCLASAEGSVAGAPRSRDAPSRQASTRSDSSLAKSLADGFTGLEDGHFEEARATFERAIALAETAGDVRGEAEAYRGLGRARSALREFAAGREAYESALALFERAGDDRGVGRVLNHLGTDAFQQGRVADARQYYDRALGVFSTAGLPDEEANILRNQVFLPDRSLDDRLRLIALAVERARAGGASITEGLALHTWGDLLFNRSEYAAAKMKLDEALVILEPAGAGRGRDLARLYTSLGRLYRVHGDPARALTFYQRALERQRALRDVAGEIQSLNAIALAFNAMDRVRDAGQRYDEALALARASKSPQIGFILQQVGIFDAEQRRYTRAAALLEEALARSPLPAERPRAQGVLAKTYASLGRHGEAADMADRAVGAAHESGDVDALRSAYYSRAQVALAGGRIAPALDDARESLRMIERLRPNLLPTDPLKLGFGERLQQQFAFTISLMVNAGLVEEAFVASEQGRSRAFLDLLASHGPNGKADAELSSMASAEAPSLDQLKDTVARLGSTAISYWVTPTSTFVWVVTSEGLVRGREIQVGAARLRKLVQSTWAAPEPSRQRGRASQTSAPEDRLTVGGRVDRAFRDLYDILVEPVRSWLPRGDGPLLTVVPHGPLLRLSFASLLNERGRYLVEGYRLHYTPALSVLAFTAPRKIAGRADRVLIVTDPSPAPALRAAEHLLPLPGARREADAIANVSQGASVRKLTGTAARESSVRAEAGNWTTLHFAAHAVVSDDRPLASYLALAGNSREGDDDGRLTVEEIYGLELHADLVVLSACRTAAGRVTGDGIVGLTRAFISAGTPSVIASAWDLSDETTPELFAAFYLARTRGADVSAALRAAQLQILRALRTASIAVSTPAGRFTVPEHPSIWGGLQLWGEP